MGKVFFPEIVREPMTRPGTPQEDLTRLKRESSVASDIPPEPRLTKIQENKINVHGVSSCIPLVSHASSEYGL